jgi:hypothetical protein
MTDAAGKRRLDDPKDTVRQELQTALSSGMRVFPLLVGGAKMPPEEELPGELQALARRNALEVREQDWNEISRSWSRRSSGRWDGRRPSPQRADLALPSTQSVDQWQRSLSSAWSARCSWAANRRRRTTPRRFARPQQMT